MECPHVEQSIAFKSDPKMQDKIISACICSVCSTDQSIWMCMACGVMSCGRYIKGHAIDHFICMNKTHPVCFDCENFAVFCYSCDDFVVNDTEDGAIHEVRKKFEKIKSSDCGSGGKRKRTNSLSSLSDGDDLAVEKKKISDNELVSGAASIEKSRGLRNLGNTCFMNAVLQALCNIEQFRSYFRGLPELREHCPKRRKSYCTRSSGTDTVLLSEEVRKIFGAMWMQKPKPSPLSPDSLFSVVWKVVPRFRGYQQQDAHEFLRYMLDRLHTELCTQAAVAPLPHCLTTTNGGAPVTCSAAVNSSLSSHASSPPSSSDHLAASTSVTSLTAKSSLVTSFFGGVLQNEVRCLACGAESKKHDPFLDLSLDIPQHFTAKCATQKNGQPVCRLSDCLESFTELEELSESELYFCVSCKRRQRSTKKFWIRRLPNVLCLHLKRFRWSSGHRQKLETFVEFPLSDLDLSPYLLRNLHETRGTYGSTVYDLVSVVVHHGSGAGSGHYTAFARQKGIWFHFNDHSVRPVNLQAVLSCKAYILFYVRRNFHIRT